MTKLFSLTITFALLLVIAGCGVEEQPIEAGSICTIRDGEGNFVVAKVLVLDDSNAHLMIFKNTYETRPAGIGPQDLKLSEPDRSVEEQMGIPHVAMTKEEFYERMPVVVAFEPVVPEDLKGYNVWKSEH